MNETFLEKVCRKTRLRASYLRSRGSELIAEALDVRGSKLTNTFSASLRRQDRNNIIAEIKRASPSKGVIAAEIDVGDLAKDYESGGAAAVSVLTEPDFFRGGIDDLRAAASAVHIPILQKDFIVNEMQIYEAAANGADAILLIVAALSETELRSFLELTDRLGMDAIVEAHTADEMTAAVSAGSQIIGVNNRDLRSLEVSIDVSRKLIAGRPRGTLMVAESGLSHRHQITELRELGFDAFLIGESLMRSADPVNALRQLSNDREVGV